jgi:hypothetical protein
MIANQPTPVLVRDETRTARGQTRLKQQNDDKRNATQRTDGCDEAIVELCGEQRIGEFVEEESHHAGHGVHIQIGKVHRLACRPCVVSDTLEGKESE